MKRHDIILTLTDTEATIVAAACGCIAVEWAKGEEAARAAAKILQEVEAELIKLGTSNGNKSIP